MKKHIKFFGIMLFAALAFMGCKDEEKNIIISAVANDDTYGSVTGTGAYAEGETVTLTATPNEGYIFVRWNDGNTANPRVFKASENVVYTAVFAPKPTGDGKCTVTWKGESWEAMGIYAVMFEASDNTVTLELYKDPADTTQPVVVCIFPMQEGTFEMTQGNNSLAFLYYDYPGQTGNYEGQEIPPYQAVQGVTMTIDAIDVENGIVQGNMRGQFVNIEEYVQGMGSSPLYEMTIDFNACQWVDVSE